MVGRPEYAACPDFAGHEILRQRRCGYQVSRVASSAKLSGGNADAERTVQTIRRGCLDWLLIAGRRHLEQALGVDTKHDNAHRPHRAHGLSPPDRTPPERAGPLERRDLLEA